MTIAASLARAEMIGVDALRALTPGAGEVAAVFRRSVYIRCGAAWACLGNSEIGAGPLNILVDLRCNWSTLVSPGEPVRVTGDRLHVGRVPVAIARTAIWTAPSVPGWTERSLSDGLTRLDDMLRRYPPPDEGLGCFAVPEADPFSIEARAAAPTIAALIRWLGGDVPVPDAAALLGMGPGLTPSGDDYLAGMLAALHATGRGNLHRLLWSVIGPQRHSLTTAISAAHLGCAAEGRLAARQHLMLNAILTADEAALREGVMALAAESHMSAWDGLAGMVAVLRSAIVPGGETAERNSCKEAAELHTTQ